MVSGVDMAEIKWILTCDGECPEGKDLKWFSENCPWTCACSYYEKEEPNTEVPDGE